MSESRGDDDALLSQHGEQADGSGDAPGRESGGPDGHGSDATPPQGDPAAALDRHRGSRLGPGGQGAADLYGSDDEPLAGLTVSATSYQGPLPPALEYGGYEDVLEGSADRILGMAEKALDAQVEHSLVPVRAEARGFLFATYATTLLPYFVLAMGFILILLGEDGAGFVSIGVGLLATGPHLIAATRRALGRSGPGDPTDPEAREIE